MTRRHGKQTRLETITTLELELHIHWLYRALDIVRNPTPTPQYISEAFYIKRLTFLSYFWRLFSVSVLTEFPKAKELS